MSTLYIVSTPIGNAQDITIRAIKTLFRVDVILSEQKDKTYLFLKKIKEEYPEITKGEIPIIISFNEFEEELKLPKVIQLLLEGKLIALVSEAGTPLLSDPGFKLVREALKRKIPITPIPGASAILTALASAGLPADKFLFVGFSPKSSNKRKKFYNDLKNLLLAAPFDVTVIFYESPHRLIESVEDLSNVFPHHPFVVAKELTKIHEAFFRGNIEEVLEALKTHSPKGEYVLLLRSIRSSPAHQQ